jgi:hypothetical protein
MADTDVFVVRGVIVLIAVILGWMIIYFVYHSGLKTRECGAANARPLNGSIRSMSASDPACKYGLRDYYIMSASNACSGGAMSNDYVDVCNLKSVLRQGCRGIDLEIYNIGGKPVVSTGTNGSNYYVKNTLNFVSFDDVMSVLKNYGFSAATAPNPTDPIILHLRIKSSDPLVYSSMAATFKAYSSILLGKEYSFEYGGKNIGAVPILQLSGKIIVVLDRKDPVFINNKELMEYCNMTSSSIMMRALPYRDVVGTPDLNELQTFNKQHMTVCTPDDNSNPSGIVLREAGVQMQCFAWQLEDSQQAEANVFFDGVGYAFALKPERLRYVETTIPTPTAQNPAVNYAPKTISAPYYNFNI